MNATCSAHADQRLRERRVVGWQVVDGLETAKLLLERPEATPNPTVEFEQLLPDGTPIMAVWSWMSQERLAKLVNLHFFDR